jgi:hypothetical protein
MGATGMGATGMDGIGCACCGTSGTNSREVSSGSWVGVGAVGVSATSGLLGARRGGNKSLPGRVTRSWSVPGWRSAGPESLTAGPPSIAVCWAATGTA